MAIHRLAETQIAAIILHQRRRRRVLRINRIFRDRSQPFDAWDDDKQFSKFRFRRQDILSITDDIEGDADIAHRTGSLSPLLQVLVTLRYYASGSFQDVCGELIGIDQSTVSRTVTRVTDTFLRQVPTRVKLPDQRRADRTKAKFYQTNGFPNVIVCIDWTQIRIQGPSAIEHEFEQEGLSIHQCSGEGNVRVFINVGT